jgi:hypothetical protein
MRAAGVLAWAGASILLMVIGALGPWAKVLFVTIDGTDEGKDGWIVLALALVAAAFLLLFLRAGWRWLPLAPLLAGCIAGATVGYDISDINNLASDAPGPGLVSTEWGIYVALVGSASLVLASIVLVLTAGRPAPR